MPMITSAHVRRVELVSQLTSRPERLVEQPVGVVGPSRHTTEIATQLVATGRK